MKKTLIVLSLTIFSIASVFAYRSMMQHGPLAYAQEAGTSEGSLEGEIIGRGIGEERELAPLDQKLARIEARLARIEQARKIGKGEAQGLEQDMQDYANSMKAAYDNAATEARTAAETQGKQGNPARLAAFEAVAKRHEQRAQGVKQRVETVQNAIQVGAVDLDDSVLDEMTPDDKQQFSNFLSDNARQQYQQRHPGKIPGKRVSLLDRLGVATVAQGIKDLPCAVSGALTSVYVAFLNTFGPSEAHAYYAAKCVSPCWSRNWSACATCVFTSGSIVVGAYNVFKSCWSACGTCAWYRPWGCACKTGCLLVFVGVLA